MATKEAETWIFWDISSCPVSSSDVASRVGPCIKRALENLGYSGCITITAIGILTDIDTDILRAVYSSGVSLTHVSSERLGITLELMWWIKEHPIPANFMLISGDEIFRRNHRFFEEARHTVIQKFPFDQQDIDSTPVPSPVWENFLASLRPDAIESGVLEKEPGLVCGQCCLPDQQGFENFTKHLKTHVHVFPESSPRMMKRKQPEASLNIFGEIP
ncbi:unnamed protein product, partial [Arabidopsis halleri]